MGCGGSKEEKKEVAAAPVHDKPQPIKKIRTNFSDVHYDEPASARRETVYAPSERPDSRRPTEIEEVPSPPLASRAGDGLLSPGIPGTPLTSPGVGGAPEIQRSQSWWEKRKEAKSGKQLSDEDYKKAFGMTRAEFAVMMKDRPGVGGKQGALWAGDQGWIGGGGGDG